MDSNFNLNGKPIAPDALRPGDDAARAGFDRTTMEGGQSAGQNVVQLCLPFGENEERAAFPAPELPPDLQRGNLRPEIIDVMPLISDFGAKRDALNVHDQSIASKIEELLQATHGENNCEVAEIANNPRVHEIIEDEVIHPAVVLIGK